MLIMRDNLKWGFMPKLIFAAMALATASTGHAQTTSARMDENPGAGDILVTATQAVSATKTDTPLVETPESISVVTRDRLDRQVITDSLTDILSYVPGILASPYGFDTRVDRFAIRGFDAASAGLYRDSLQLPSFGDSDRSFRIEPYGLERLEVLRGPSSVLYGNGSLGGLVNAISKRPTTTTFGELELEAGNYKRFAGKFDFGGAVNDAGTLAYRLTGLARDSDTQVDFARNDRLYIAPALTWAPDQATSITLLTHYMRSITAGGAQGLPAAGTLFDSPNGSIPISRSAGEPDFERQRNTEYSIGYAASHRFGEHLTFRQNTRYDHLNVNARVAYGYAFDPVDPTDRLLLRGSFTGREKANAIAIDNQMQATFATGPIAHTLLVGVEYKHIKLDDAQGGDAIPSIDIYAPVYGAAVPLPPLYLDSTTRQSQTGLYVQERMKIADRLIISLGGRQDFVRKRQSDTIEPSDTRTRDSKFSGSAGAVYVTDIGLSPYVSYSESFLPVFNSDRFGRPFDPETGRQYEAGVKFQPKGGDSYVTVAAFDLKRNNVLTTDPVNPQFSVQTGAQKSRGIEFEAVASLLRSALKLTAAYTYQHVQVVRSNDGDVGNRPPIVPANIASLYVDYAPPGGALAGFGLGGGVRYQGSTFGDQDNSFKVSGFTVFDAAARYDWGHLRFAISAKNLFDRKYVASCYSITGCNYGQARAVVGTARYRF